MRGSARCGPAPAHPQASSRSTGLSEEHHCGRAPSQHTRTWERAWGALLLQCLLGHQRRRMLLLAQRRRMLLAQRTVPSATLGRCSRCGCWSGALATSALRSSRALPEWYTTHVDRSARSRHHIERWWRRLALSEVQGAALARERRWVCRAEEMIRTVHASWCRVATVLLVSGASARLADAHPGFFSYLPTAHRSARYVPPTPEYTCKGRSLPAHIERR